jgi:hypothetical protein
MSAAQTAIDSILQDNVASLLTSLDAKMAKDGIIVLAGYAQYFNDETSEGSPGGIRVPEQISGPGQGGCKTCQHDRTRQWMARGLCLGKTLPGILQVNPESRRHPSDHGPELAYVQHPRANDTADDWHAFGSARALRLMPGDTGYVTWTAALQFFMRGIKATSIRCHRFHRAWIQELPSVK